MTKPDPILDSNRAWAKSQFGGALPIAPARQMAVVACMDSRMPIFPILGLKPGEAHVIRNAGGVVTDDVIRSLLLSQRLLGTREIVLVHHTDCGLMKISEDQMRAEIEQETGVSPRFAMEAFKDPFVDVRQSIRRLQRSPFLKHRDKIRGFVYEIETGMLKEVFVEESEAATK